MVHLIKLSVVRVLNDNDLEENVSSFLQALFRKLFSNTVKSHEKIQSR